MEKPAYDLGTGKAADKNFFYDVLQNTAVFAAEDGQHLVGNLNLNIKGSEVNIPLTFSPGKDENGHAALFSHNQTGEIETISKLSQTRDSQGNDRLTLTLMKNDYDARTQQEYPHTLASLHLYPNEKMLNKGMADPASDLLKKQIGIDMPEAVSRLRSSVKEYVLTDKDFYKPAQGQDGLTVPVQSVSGTLKDLGKRHMVMEVAGKEALVDLGTVLVPEETARVRAALSSAVQEKTPVTFTRTEKSLEVQVGNDRKVDIPASHHMSNDRLQDANRPERVDLTSATSVKGKLVRVDAENQIEVSTEKGLLLVHADHGASSVTTLKKLVGKQVEVGANRDGKLQVKGLELDKSRGR